MKKRKLPTKKQILSFMDLGVIVAIVLIAIIVSGISEIYKFVNDSYTIDDSIEIKTSSVDYLVQDYYNVQMMEGEVLGTEDSLVFIEDDNGEIWTIEDDSLDVNDRVLMMIGYDTTGYDNKEDVTQNDGVVIKYWYE